MIHHLETFVYLRIATVDFRLHVAPPLTRRKTQ